MEKQKEKVRGTSNNAKKHWKIIVPKGEVMATMETDSSRNYFLRPAAGVASSQLNEAETILAFGQIKPIIKYLGYSQQEVASVLEVDPSTLFRWKKEDKPIGKLRSKIMYDIDDIITKGVRIFGSEESFKEWLDTTNYALGDKRPIELLKDPYGIELVDDAIEAMSWGNVL